MILPIYIYGQPILRKQAEDITADHPGLDELITNMFETLTAANGVGLAAPQVGLSIRLVVIDLTLMADDFPEYKDFRKVYINPRVIEFDNNSKKVVMEEGCLSIPGINENVTRPTRIHVKYLDSEMNAHDEWVEGYLARVMQHEFDHLDATMFVDKVSPFRKQLIKNKLKALTLGRYQCSYKTKPLHK